MSFFNMRRVAAAVAVTGMAFVAGAAGAQAATSPIPVSEVAAHNTPEDCWVIVSGGVYNMTPMVAQGGPAAQAITTLCGKNGTDVFVGQYGPSATDMIKPYFVATVQETKPVPVRKYTVKQIAKHKTPGNCWVIVNKGVYNMSQMASQGGPAGDAIKTLCGKNGTKVFVGQYGSGATAMIKSFQIGVIKK